MSSEFGTGQRGDIVAGWVHAYGDQLYSWAYHKTSQRAVSEDLVQDTFIAAFASFERFKNLSTPKTWLFSILNNKIAEHFHRQLKRSGTGFTTSDGEPKRLFDNLFDGNGEWRKESRPRVWEHEENLLDNNDFQAVFNGCMQKLPPNWYACIQLKFLSGKKSEEVCQELGITKSNLWQVLHRAKLQLRKCITEHWFKT